MKKIILPIVFIILCASCFQKKLNKPFSYSNFTLPPGTVKMNENLFVDAQEIRNVDYLEFMQWTKQLFSPESEDYKKILPDTNVWIKDPKFYNNPYTVYYLRHPAYHNHPVVGINYEQAQAFCKWRSDRVMEFILLTKGVLKNNPAPTKENYFTIERYFNGKFGKVNDDIYLNYYPQYSLIDTSLYLKIVPFADSLNKEKLKHSFHKKDKEKKLEIWCRGRDIKPNNYDITRPVSLMKPEKIIFIENIKGNVRELTSDKNLSFGGSFFDSCDTVMKKNFYKNTEPNWYTGFRCKCSYIKWK